MFVRTIIYQSIVLCTNCCWEHLDLRLPSLSQPRSESCSSVFHRQICWRVSRRSSSMFTHCSPWSRLDCRVLRGQTQDQHPIHLITKKMKSWKQVRINIKAGKVNFSCLDWTSKESRRSWLLLCSELFRSNSEDQSDDWVCHPPFCSSCPVRQQLDSTSAPSFPSKQSKQVSTFTSSQQTGNPVSNQSVNKLRHFLLLLHDYYWPSVKK